MAVSIITQSQKSITLQVTIPFTRSMMDSRALFKIQLIKWAALPRKNF